MILICIWEGLGQRVLQERGTNDIHCILSDQGCSHIPDPTLRSIHSWGISSSLSSSTCCPYSMLQRICVFFLCFIITIVVHLYSPKNCSLLMFSSEQKLLWVGLYSGLFSLVLCWSMFYHLLSFVLFATIKSSLSSGMCWLVVLHTANCCLVDSSGMFFFDFFCAGGI